MANLLQQGLDFLHAQQKLHVSGTVAVRRGANTTSDVAATPGRTEFEESTDYGAQIIHAHDWLIAAADYQVDGTVVEPADGDQIRVTESDGTVRVFEVAPFGNEPAFRYTDPGRGRLRIHTREIDEVAP